MNYPSSKGASRLGVILCLILFSYSPARSGRALFVDQKVLEFSVVTDKEAYRIDDDIRVTYRIRNRSDRAVLVPVGSPGCGVFVGLDVKFLQENNEEPEIGVSDDCWRIGPVPTPIEQAKNQSSIVLGEGNFFGAEKEILTGVYRNLKPGRYKILVTLKSWDSNEFSTAEREELSRRYSQVLTGSAEQVVWVRLK